MSNFKPFATSVTDKFNSLSKERKVNGRTYPTDLYVTDTSKDELYQFYLDAFPEGTNPIYRTRREFECTCCSNFIRGVGNVVSIIDDAIVSVWDVEGLEYPYDVVAKAMSGYVKSKPIRSVFSVKERNYGIAETRELIPGPPAQVTTWHHFHAAIPSRQLSASPGQVMGDSQNMAQLMKRGLTELSLSAVDTVLELIEANALYRGAEHKAAVVNFRDLKVAYDACKDKEMFIWKNISNHAARFRNMAIGSLVVDLSEGVEVDAAVHSFGSKMEGYKRPKNPVISPNMRKDALKTIDELGLEPSLSRRPARISDISVNDVLFVDNEVRGQMRDSGGIAALLSSQTKEKAPDLTRATPISIEEFMSSVLPTATSMDILFENDHLGNLVSITAPNEPEAPNIFKWDKNFAWSYKDNNADSIKQKVKAAGGNVTAPLRVSLEWYNFDDLDIHAYDPNNNHIYYGNKCGKLDVDMNAGGPRSRTPVENICWLNPTDGPYRIVVDNYSKRESIDVGFTLEVESLGEITRYHYRFPVGSHMSCLNIQVKGGKAVSIKTMNKVEAGDSSKEEWGLKTQTMVKVDTIVLSPNHWGDNAVGNKHYFFLLHGCVNPDPIRGIYGEFLRDDLYQKHRKVFEVLGDLTKAQPTDDQLSGLGFSSTRKDKVRVLVQERQGHGSASKAYEINF